MTALKFLAIWSALLIGQVIGGGIAQLVLAAPPVTIPHDGPFDLAAALGIVTLADALVLSLLAARLRAGFVARTAVLFTLFYGIGSGLPVVEAVYFNDYIKMPIALLLQTTLASAIQAGLAAPVAAALWTNDPNDRLADEHVAGLWWRIALIALIYVVFYFGAGALIAWQDAALRAYYEQNAHIDRAQVALLQVGRGLIWAALALIGVRRLTGSPWFRAVMIGLAFSVLMAISLLIPNPFMPWEVREYHLAEVSSSNLLFGIAAAWILLAGIKSRAPNS